MCRGHTLSWTEGSLQLAFLMVRGAQTGVLFSSVPCTQTQGLTSLLFIFFDLFSSDAVVSLIST